MERTEFKSEDYKSHKIVICYSSDEESPRDWDNLGIIYSNKRSYDVDGKKMEDLISECGCDPDDYRGKLISDLPFERFSKNFVWLKVYCYEHGGITIKVADENPYPDQMWDSGLFGIIAVSKEKLRKEYGWKLVTEKRAKFVRDILNGEIETLDMWFTGEVYGYVVVDGDGNELDSCWGYYGDDGIEEAIAEAKGYIDYKEQNN